MTLIKMLQEFMLQKLRDKLLAEFNICQEADNNLTDNEFDEDAHYILEETMRELNLYINSVYNILAYLNNQK